MTIPNQGAETPDPTRDPEADVFEQVLATVKGLVGELHPGSPVVDIGPDTRLDMSLGLDSLSFLELRDRLEVELHLSIPDSLFVEGLTPRDWYRAIAAEATEASTKGLDAPPERSAQAVAADKVTADVDQVIEREPGPTDRSVPIKVERLGHRSGPGRVLDLAYGVYATTIAVIVAGAAWPFIAVVPMPQRWRYSFTRVVGTILRRLIGIRLNVVGAMPQERPVLVVANHPSFVDGLVLIVAIKEPMTFLVGAAFERQFLVGRLLTGLGCVFVASGSATDAASLTDQFVDLFEDGHSIGSFPEGHLEWTPELGNFYLGSFRAAAAAGVPVVPVGIVGTRSIVAPGTRLPRPGAIRVKIGAPILPTATDWHSLLSLRDAARSAIAELSGTPV